MSDFFTKAHNQLLGSLVLLGILASLGSYTYFTIKQADYYYSGPTTISVTGDGEVVSVPDIGKFSFTVTESGAEAAAALEASSAKVNSVIAALKEAGVEEKDIKTESYSLYPKYKYESAPCAFGMYCPQEQVEDGFEVSQSVTVKVRDLTKAGNLISQVGEKEVAYISSLEFTIDNDEAAKAEARSLAVKQAREKAEALAKDLGVKLGDMVSYYEDEPYQSYPTPMGGDMMAFSEAKALEGAELPLGENTTTSRVNLTYQVK